MAEFDLTQKFEDTQLLEGIRLMESIIGGRWNPMILFAIEQGANRFTDIKNSIDHISDTELARKLAGLVENRLVIKDEESEARRSTYTLSPFGGDITHTLHHIMDISIKHGELS